METSTLPFPTEQGFGFRLERAQVAMRRAGIDVLAVSGFDYLRFFTGLNGLPVGRPVWLVVLERGPAAFVSPRSEAMEARARCATPVAAEWVEWEEPMPAPMTHQDALAKYIGEVAPEAHAIGVDFGSTWAHNVEAVRHALGAERIRDATSLLRDQLLVKDTVAIEGIRRGADVVANQFDACRAVVAPGVAEWQVVLASVTAAIRRNAEILVPRPIQNEGLQASF